MDEYICLSLGGRFYIKQLKNPNKVVLWHSSLHHRFLLPVEITCDALNSEPCFSLQRVRQIPLAERRLLSTATLII